MSKPYPRQMEPGETQMRYVSPISKLVYTGSRAMYQSILREQLKPAPPKKPVSNEYPIFFMHGFMGFAEMKIFDIKLFDYFNGVKELLEQMGYTVFTKSVTPIAPPQDRAKEWARHITDVLQQTGAEKVHIIAHSQGCIDARVVAAPPTHSCTTLHGCDLHGMGMDEQIASITTIGGPHLGTPLADDTDDTEIEKLMIEMIGFIALITGSSETKAREAIESMSREYMTKTFNQHIKVPNTIPCYTVAGNPKDKKYVSFLFDRTWEALMQISLEDGGGDNDGFVPVSSARFDDNNTKLAGTDEPQWQHLGEITADHIAMIGIPVEFTRKQVFSHLPMYVGLAQNVDTCYKRNITLALNADGEWTRICNLLETA